MKTPFVFGKLAKENNFTDRKKETAHLVTNFKSIKIFLTTIHKSILFTPIKKIRNSLIFFNRGRVALPP